MSYKDVTLRYSDHLSVILSHYAWNVGLNYLGGKMIPVVWR